MQRFGSPKKYQTPITKSSKPSSCNSSRVSSKAGNELWMWVGLVVVIILILSLSLWYSNCNGDTFSEKFSNTFKKKGSNPELRDMDVLFFMSPSCGWCQKMKGVMEKENTIGDVKLVDVTKPEGLELAKQYGSIDKGVPSFVSKKLKTGTVGFKETTAELIQSLKKAKDSPQPDVPPMNPEEALKKIADLQVVLFTSPTCGWCKKAKEALGEAGVADYVEVVDISTPDGKALVQQQIPEFRGVPVAKSKVTGKISTGYKAVPQLIAELS